MTKAEAIRFRDHLNSIIESLEDSDALEVFDLFPVWVSGKTYYGPNEQDHAQSKVQYEDTLYKCVTTHTAQSDWTPSAAVSLWTRMDNPAIEWPEWVQPVGSLDAYDNGAKVSHNGKHWISNTPNNVWEPGVYGWDEVVA